MADTSDPQRQQLATRLSLAHEQLAETTQVDEESKKLLVELLHDIERLLGEPASEEEKEPEHTFLGNPGRDGAAVRGESPDAGHCDQNIGEALARAGI